MKVLIAGGDLWGTVGGGQTIYRALVAQNPDVEFTYPRRDEPADAPRPANARALQVPHVVPRALLAWLRARRGDALARAGVTAPMLEAWAAAQALAAAVAGRDFDVVEVPDYLHVGVFLADALARRGVRAGRLVVSLHGCLSRTFELDWRPDAARVAAVRELERLQYGCADLRYGISGRYVDEVRARTGLPAVLVDPLPLLARPAPVRTVGSPAPPDLQFVGRLDRFKGPDLFVELTRWLPRDAFGAARLIAPDVELDGGGSARALLDGMIRARGADVRLEPGVPPAQVKALFARRALTVLPSRTDTLNLVALESLFAGCPTAIAGSAGVCQLLRSALPRVPFLAIDPARPQRAAAQVLEVLRDYDRAREALVDALERMELPAGPVSLPRVYEGASGHDAAARAEAARLDGVLRALVEGQPAGARRLFGAADGLVARVGLPARSAVKAQGASALARLGRARALLGARGASDELRALLALPEDVRLDPLRALARTARTHRAPIFDELARLEALGGRAAVAAAYRLRVRRWRGEEIDERGATPAGEAGATALEQVEDARGGGPVVASLIVALSSAGPSRSRCLDALAQQTLVRARRAEVVLIDASGVSVHDEEVAEWPRGVEVVRGRTASGVSVHAAWNAGLTLARAPLVALLHPGAELRPDALEVLVGALERRPEAGWARGSTLLADLDASGDARDRGLLAPGPELALLEPAHASVLGGLYRRALLDRCGRFDERFGSTACAEVDLTGRLRRLAAPCAAPGTLVTVWVAPGERAEDELDEVRAWDAHRTVAALLAATRTDDDLERLLVTALRFTRPGAARSSTDLDLAAAAARAFARRTGRAHPLAPGVERLLDAYRRLDQRASPLGGALVATAVAREHTRLLPSLAPDYALWSDARHERRAHVYCI